MLIPLQESGCGESAVCLFQSLYMYQNSCCLIPLMPIISNLVPDGVSILLQDLQRKEAFRVPRASEPRRWDEAKL